MSADELDQDEAGPGPRDEPVIEETPLFPELKAVLLEAFDHAELPL